jgi:hypothetical protein
MSEASKKPKLWTLLLTGPDGSRLVITASSRQAVIDEFKEHSKPGSEPAYVMPAFVKK